MSKKTAIQKRDMVPAPEVKVLTEPKGANYPPGRMLISSPKEIAEVVTAVPFGAVMTMSALRRALANRHNADYTCPLTTGIFLRVAAEAADEEGSALPYWRVVRDDGRLLDKLPGGASAQAAKLRAEGQEMDNRGRLSRVE